MVGPVTIAVSDAMGLRRACALLVRGGLVAFPTETVYGLGVDAANPVAVRRLFAAKGRPANNPLIVHCLDAASAWRIAQPDERARELAARFWPGPLTLVLPWSGRGVCSEVRAGLTTVAVRVPADATARCLIAGSVPAIAAPSANRFSRLSPTSADQIDRRMIGLDLVLDGGDCSVGVESTILDLTADLPILLRPGGLPVEIIEPVIGSLALVGKSSQAESSPRAPGQFLRHYAPSKPMRLVDIGDDAAQQGEVLLIMGVDADPPYGREGYHRIIRLSLDGTIEDAARRLFTWLHWCQSNPEISAIAVVPASETGLGRAINDRLRRGTVSQ